jgi:transposase
VRLAGRLDTAATPLDSLTFRAAVSVVLARDQSDPAGIGRLGYPRFARLVTSQLARWGGVRRCQRIMRAVWTAATDPSRLTDGVLAQRPGGLERAALVLGDWHHALGQLAETEQRMTGILDQLQLTSLVASIPGLSAVGAAAILAETGDPARFDSARALVKHAGLCPRANQSGAYTGTTRISGRGRPALRLAAWRATWGALAHNPVLAARHRRRPARPPQGGNHPGRLRAADQRAGRARRLLGDHPASEHEQPRPSPPQARIQDVGTNPVGR